MAGMEAIETDTSPWPKSPTPPRRASTTSLTSSAEIISGYCSGRRSNSSWPRLSIPGNSWKNWLACPDRIGNRPMTIKPITRTNNKNTIDTAGTREMFLPVSFLTGPSSI